MARKQNIILLSPPFPILPGEAKYTSPPLGLAYLAAVLESEDYNVRIIDCVAEGKQSEKIYGNRTRAYGLTPSQVIPIIAEFDPCVIGISLISYTVETIALSYAEEIKSNFPHVVLVLGGVHASSVPRDLIVNPYVDYVVQGEGEYSLLKLVKYLSGSGQIQNIENLVWKNEGKVIANNRKFIENIDDLPFPARHLLDLVRYEQFNSSGSSFVGKKATYLLTSRGCTENCTFCSVRNVWGGKFRAHSPEYVIQEIVELYYKYGIRHYYFCDDNITLLHGRAEKLFRGIIKLGLDISWTVPNGIAINSLSKDLLLLMRDSGCVWISLAVESGDERVLKDIIGKRLDLKQVDEVVSFCKKIGLKSTAFFVLGLPGETIETMNNSMKYATELAVDFVVLSAATPYPGTVLHDICVENGFCQSINSSYLITTNSASISTPEFSSGIVNSLIRKTIIKRAFKHPIGTLFRLFDMIQNSPTGTIQSILHKVFPHSPN